MPWSRNFWIHFTSGIFSYRTVLPFTLTRINPIQNYCRYSMNPELSSPDIHVQYLCKMSNGHLNVHWTFLFVHWTNGHLNVHWTFLFAQWTNGHLNVEWTFLFVHWSNGHMNVDPMDISVRPMVEWSFVYVQWTLLIFNTKYDNADNAFCLLKAIMN